MLNAATHAVLAFLMLALLLAGGWWLVQRPVFALKVIRIESPANTQLLHVNALTIRSTAIPRIRGNFFTANLDSVRLAFEAVPWVRKATVRRAWPNQLIVTLEEHHPLGTWGDDGRLLSVQGDVFTANLAEAEEHGPLQEFSGPEGHEKEVVARFVELRNWFAPIKLVPESVQLSNRYAWSVKLNNGWQVELGREQSTSTLKERVDRLVAIYPQLLTRFQDKIDSVRQVDMRYPNGLALKISKTNKTSKTKNK